MIIIADKNPDVRDRIATGLGRADVTQAGGLQQLRAIVERSTGEPGVIVLGPDLVDAQGLRFVEELHVSAPQVSVVLVAGALTSDLLHRALRAGARDALPTSFTPDQIRDAVGRAETIAQSIAMPLQRAIDLRDSVVRKAVTVSSSKGGVGKTFLACNLAVALAQQTGEPVAALDLDVQFGDLALMLQLTPQYTIYDAAQNLDRLDHEALRGYLTPHPTQVQVLAALFEPGLAEQVTSDAVRRILQLLKASFRFVIVDTPPNLNDHVLAALDESDECVLVTSLDVPSVKGLQVSLDTIRVLGFDRERIRIVLNRADSKVGLRVRDVEKTLNTTVDYSIPSSRHVPLSINRATPLVFSAPKSHVSRTIRRLAEQIAGPTPPSGAAAEAAPAEEVSRR